MTRGWRAAGLAAALLMATAAPAAGATAPFRLVQEVHDLGDGARIGTLTSRWTRLPALGAYRIAVLAGPGSSVLLGRGRYRVRLTAAAFCSRAGTSRPATTTGTLVVRRTGRVRLPARVLTPRCPAGDALLAGDPAEGARLHLHLTRPGTPFRASTEG